MAYTKTSWANYPSTASPLNAENMNHLETQYDQAIAENPTAPAVRIQNADGSYPSIADVPAGRMIMYFGPTAPDPATARQPCTYYQATVS